MKKKLFTGVGVALVTPFKDGKVNFNKLGELIEYQIRADVDALIICGSTGEASTLTDEEHIETIKYSVEVANKRIPIIAGVGSNDTNHAIYLSTQAERVGADGLLSVTPYYNKTTQKGLIEHYSMIASKVSIPIILYNIPSRTGLNIEPQTIKVLSEIDNIIGIKECNFSQMIETRSICNKDFMIYTGDDINITAALGIGANGVISTMGNIIPEETKKITNLFMNGNIEKAIEHQISLTRLIKALFCEVNPIPLKFAMNFLGYDVGPCRHPLTEMETKNQELLKTVLLDYKLMK